MCMRAACLLFGALSLFSCRAARNTGGGVISHAVQGAAHFASSSPDVVIEGKYAARDGDLVTRSARRSGL